MQKCKMQPPTKQQLLDSIHCLFEQDFIDKNVTQKIPEFWVEPNASVVAQFQKLSHRAVENDKPEARYYEKVWLHKPNPRFGGKSPNEMLDGDESDREKLATALAAVRQCAFT